MPSYRPVKSGRPLARGIRTFAVGSLPEAQLDPPDPDYHCDECGVWCEDEGANYQGSWLCPDCLADAKEDEGEEE